MRITVDIDKSKYPDITHAGRYHDYITKLGAIVHSVRGDFWLMYVLSTEKAAIDPVIRNIIRTIAKELKHSLPGAGMVLSFYEDDNHTLIMSVHYDGDVTLTYSTSTTEREEVIE